MYGYIHITHAVTHVSLQRPTVPKKIIFIQRHGFIIITNTTQTNPEQNTSHSSFAQADVSYSQTFVSLLPPTVSYFSKHSTVRQKTFHSRS